MAAIISCGVATPGIYSTAARSLAKFTAALTIPGTFLFKARSMLAAQFAQVMPVSANSALLVGTENPETWILAITSLI